MREPSESHFAYQTPSPHGYSSIVPQIAMRGVGQGSETVNRQNPKCLATALSRIRSRLGPRMGLQIGGPKSGGADVGVDLGGDEAFVAQQLLNAANIGAAIEQVRGEAM